MTNTSCVFVEASRNCVYQQADEADSVTSRPQSGSTVCDQRSPEGQLRVQIDVQNHEGRLFNFPPGQIVRATCGLDPRQQYSVRVRFLRSADTSDDSYLHFKGAWLSRGGQLLREQEESIAHIEFVTSTDNMQPWASTIASSLNVSHVVVDGRRRCKTTYSDSCASLQDHYFASGTTHAVSGSFASRFDSTAPSAHIFELGPDDLQAILSSPGSDNRLGPAIEALVGEYTALIKLIRSTTHEYRLAKNTLVHGLDASYSYNSGAKSTPVLLVAPFNCSSRLRRLLNAVASKIAQAARADGDLFVFWIDSAGWSSAQSGHNVNVTVQKTASGMEGERFGLYLAELLCPFMCPQRECRYKAPNKYEGKLYLPNEAGMGKLLEERKLALIKEKLGIFPSA